MLEAVENKGRFCAMPIDVDGDENSSPLHLVFVNIDSKSIRDEQGRTPV
jgi:hypothetical protein